MPEKEHLLLLNKIETKTIFKINRGRDNDQAEEEEKVPENYHNLKERLRSNHRLFIRERIYRREQRSLQVPFHIEYLKLNFFQVIDDQCQNYFRSQYGLFPVSFENLNQTVFYSIIEEGLFNNFITDLQKFYNSPDNISPHMTSYSRLINIESFEFLTSERIRNNNIDGTLHFELLDEDGSAQKYYQIFNALRTYLSVNALDYNFRLEDKLVEIKNISRDVLSEILDNFDIIKSTTSNFPSRRAPGLYNEERRLPVFSFEPDLNTPIIGIIDTGIHRGGLLRPIVVDSDLDIANHTPMCFFDDNGHGTQMAFLAAFGEDFYTNSNHINTAKVLPIKIMNNGEDNYSLFDLENAIRKANARGVKIFNLSVNSKFNKLYNEKYSSYAIILDKLAYELDILIFISTGNLNYEDLQTMSQYDIFNYPNHFFNPNNPEFNEFGYACSLTNIKPPADSLNNAVVGAIADNFITATDLTPDGTQVAFYSLKWHLDYTQTMNNATIKKNQSNLSLFKPDVVCPGGDALNVGAGLEVLSNKPDNRFVSTYGTSNAAPLCANIAARIIHKYPQLSMQSVKALIINSAEKQKQIQGFEDLLFSLKQRFARNIINKEFISLDELTVKEKTKLSRVFSEKRISNILQGHGRPNVYKALNSNDNLVTFVIEETITPGTHIALKLDIPDYLNSNTSRKSSLFKIRATLCYKFNPLPNNHLAYCPVHISFAIKKNIDKSIQTSLDVLSDHENPRIEDGNFKGGLTWSDDFFPINKKPFTNCQTIGFNLSLNDLERIENSLAVIVRAHCKQNIDPALVESLKSTAHPFSLAISVEEVPYQKEQTGQLYENIKLCNDVDLLAALEQEIDLELNN